MLKKMSYNIPIIKKIPIMYSSEHFTPSNPPKSPQLGIREINDNQQLGQPVVNPLCQPQSGFWTIFVNKCKKLFGCCCIYHE